MELRKPLEGENNSLLLAKPRSVKRTIRIEADVNHKLEGLSLKQRIAFNSVLNKALRRYVEWEVFAESFNLIAVQQQMWKTLLSRLSDQEARELGKRTGAQSTIDFVTYYFHRFDLDSVLQAFRVLGAEYMRNYQFVDFGTVEGGRTVVLRHGLGPMASAFYGESLRAICSHLHVGIEIEETDDQIIARLNQTPEQWNKTDPNAQSVSSKFK